MSNCWSHFLSWKNNKQNLPCWLKSRERGGEKSTCFFPAKYLCVHFWWIIPALVDYEPCWKWVRLACKTSRPWQQSPSRICESTVELAKVSKILTASETEEMHKFKGLWNPLDEIYGMKSTGWNPRWSTLTGGRWFWEDSADTFSDSSESSEISNESHRVDRNKTRKKIMGQKWKKMHQNGTKYLSKNTARKQAWAKLKKLAISNLEFSISEIVRNILILRNTVSFHSKFLRSRSGMLRWMRQYNLIQITNDTFVKYLVKASLKQKILFKHHFNTKKISLQYHLTPKNII